MFLVIKSSLPTPDLQDRVLPQRLPTLLPMILQLLPLKMNQTCISETRGAPEASDLAGLGRAGLQKLLWPHLSRISIPFVEELNTDFSDISSEEGGSHDLSDHEAKSDLLEVSNDKRRSQNEPLPKTKFKPTESIPEVMPCPPPIRPTAYQATLMSNGLYPPPGGAHGLYPLPGEAQVSIRRQVKPRI